MPSTNASAYRNYADVQADAFGIPREFFASLINAESGWNPKAVSPKGAQGIAQLMPGTAPNIDRFDPYASMSFAASLLKQYYDKFGSWELAAAAYNAGPGAVTKYGGVPPYSETQDYIGKLKDSLGLSSDSSVGKSKTGTDLQPSMNALRIVFWASAVIVLAIVLKGISK